MSVRRFRTRRWLAFVVSLLVLASAAWLPTSVLGQAIPGNPNVPGGGGGATYPVSDEVFKVCDDGDNTKCVEFELTGVTTANTPAIIVTNTASVAGVAFGSGAFSLNPSATRAHLFVSNEYRMGSGVALSFSSGADPVVAGGDAGLERIAPSVIGPTQGAFDPGWIQMQAADDMLAADFTDADATVTDTALNVTLGARKYTFKMVLFFSNSTAADGIRVDFNGGTATVTNFRAHCLVHDTALLLSSQSTALDTDIVASTTTGASQMECNGSFEPAAGGTFIVRAAEEADGGGTLTVTRGSYIAFKDMP